MTKSEQLLQLLQTPRKINTQSVYDLHGLLERHPYFQMGYALLAKAAKEKDPATAAQAIQLAAIYATDRGHLKALLEDTLPAAVPGAQGAAERQDSEATKKTHISRRASFINDYIAKLQQKNERPITSQKSLEQQHIIQQFMQKEVTFKPRPLQAAAPDTDTATDFTKESTVFHEELATEGLAKIFVQQGKIQRALAIYNQLALKFPDKKAYFVDLIQALNSQL